jgi:ABC-2 type transport system permease protein
VFFRNIYLKTLLDQWKFTGWISVGLIAAALYTTLLFPLIRDTSGLNEFIEQLPQFILSLIGGASAFTTPEGFLNTQPFSVLAPLLVITFAVVRGSNLIAGEEESRTLDQLLANPVRRGRVAMEKAAALATSVLVLVVVLFAWILIGSAIAGFSLDLARLSQIVFSLFLLGTGSGLMALGIGLATGRRSFAGGVAAGVLAVGWLLNAIQQLAPVLEWTKFISVFWYYNGNNIFVNGMVIWHALLLTGVAACSLALGTWWFERRDLRG